MRQNGLLICVFLRISARARFKLSPSVSPSLSLPLCLSLCVSPSVSLPLCLSLSAASDNSQRFQETCFAFALTPQQVQQISSSMDISGTKCDFTVQVQLRFCLSETSCPQEDHFPPNLCVKVNGKPCNLPGYLPPTKNGVEPKRPSRPINITSVVRLSTTVPNTIVVSWTSEVGRSYSMAVYLVKQQSSTVLLQRLRSKGIRNPDHSRALIKEKLTADPDSEIATTSLRVSLLCPLGKMRLMIPCRALTCSHLQCFDATLYIQMNEKKPTWVCPVCDKKAPYEHLIIDGLFMEILNSCVDCDEIQFKEDGYWAPMRTKKEVQEVSSASYSNGLEGLHRSAVGEQRSSSSHNGGSSRMKVEVIDLTLDSSSEDDDDDQPPLKRPCPSLSPTSPPIVNKGSPPHPTPLTPPVSVSHTQLTGPPPTSWNHTHQVTLTPQPLSHQDTSPPHYHNPASSQVTPLIYHTPTQLTPLTHPSSHTTPQPSSHTPRLTLSHTSTHQLTPTLTHLSRTQLTHLPPTPQPSSQLTGLQSITTPTHQVSPVTGPPAPSSGGHQLHPPLPQLQDYRPYYHAPTQLTDLNFFSFLQGDNHQHYNMVMAAAAAASASDDHELLLNHFRPYTTSSSSSSQLFLDQSGAPSSGSLAPVNGGDGGNSSGGSSSSLVSSSSLRDTHSTHSTHSHTHPTHSHTHPGVGGRSSADVAAASLYGAVPDVISLD
ncbi:E3 SUMO-protein ligase PIAS1-like [Oncorhynchus tshawytscha]|uniref:E3 SUMO-protein ligase PIAS1-like n=1 Tax=Oncorhynchus tshawytscha TaxID=74940 RepID=UPI001C3D3408|nr:E3 SUMO-protein ligase PIAS1-like [Oncorhynchus tshawytscha]